MQQTNNQTHFFIKSMQHLLLRSPYHSKVRIEKHSSQSGLGHFLQLSKHSEEKVNEELKDSNSIIPRKYNNIFFLTLDNLSHVNIRPHMLKNNEPLPPPKRKKEKQNSTHKSPSSWYGLTGWQSPYQIHHSMCRFGWLKTNEIFNYVMGHLKIA